MIVNFRKNFSYSLLLTIFNLAFPILTLLIVIPRIGPQGTGEVVFFESISKILILIFSLGISIYGAKEIARADNTLAKNKLVNEFLSLQLYSTLIFSIITGVLTIYLIKSPDNLIIKYLPAVVVYVISNIFQVEWIYLANSKFKFIAIRTLIIRGLTFILVYWIIESDKDAVLYFWILTISYTVTSLINLKTIQINFSFKSFKNCKIHLKPLMNVFIFSLAATGYTLLDNILLAKLSGSYSLGLYSLATKIARLPNYLMSTIAYVTMPVFAAKICKRKEIQMLSQEYVEFCLIIGLPIFGAFLIFPEQLIDLAGGDQFKESKNILRIISGISILVGLANLFGTQILIAISKEKIVRNVFLGGLSVNLIMNYVLIPSYGAFGAALALISADLIITSAIYFFYTQYFDRIVFPIMRYGFYLLINVLIFIGLKLLIESSLTICIISIVFSFITFYVFQKKMFNNKLVSKLLP